MQQEQKVPSDKFEITSPTFSKSVTFCFNFDQDHPLQLISWEEEKGFTVNPLAEKFFESFKDDKLGIITIVGKNRTGKSSLLNRVILNRNSGFTVGHTINPCTKGIWIWPHIIQIQDKKGENEHVKVIVMDTEGTGATDQRDNYDTQVFMLAMLLSSYFIYNSVGAIDEKAIQNLSLIVNLSKHLQKTNEKEFEDLVDSFPSFLWVLRDFALKLVDPRGNPITAREYLENALKPQKGVSEAVESKNRIRRFLTNFFKDRDCFMMIRPTELEKDMQNLQNLEEDKLRPEFADQIGNLRRKICSKVKPKMFKGKPINGPGFIVLCKLLCQTINNGEVLSIENSWNSICKIECEKIIRELSDKYEEDFQKELQKGIMSAAQIKDLHKEKRNEMLESFRKRAMGDNLKEFEEILSNLLKQKYEFIKKIQTDEIRDKLRAVVDQKLEDFETKVHNKGFEKFIDLASEFKNIKLEIETEFTDSGSREVILDYMIQKVLSNTEVFIDEMLTGLQQTEALNKAQMSNLESRIEAVRQELESKGIAHMETIQSLEAERSKLKVELASFDEKMEEIEKEKEKMKQQADARLEALTKEFQAKEQKLEDKIKDLTQKNDNLHKEKQEISVTNEKELAMQSQQLEFSTQKVANLSQSVADLKKELAEEKHLRSSSVNALEEMRRTMDFSVLKTNRNLTVAQVEEISEDAEGAEYSSAKQPARRKRTTIINPKDDRDDEWTRELEGENHDLRKRVDILTKRIEMNVEEFHKHKEVLENMVRETENQYQERYMQSEANILALNKKLENSEMNNVALISINKKIAAALERADIRAMKIEKNMDQLKSFKRMMEYAENMFCKSCVKTINKNLYKDQNNTGMHGNGDTLQIESDIHDMDLGMSVDNLSHPSPIARTQIKHEIPRMPPRTQKASDRYLSDWAENKHDGDDYEKIEFSERRSERRQKRVDTARRTLENPLETGVDQLEQVEQNEI